jgi:DNA-binding CsgD family transcriptional regulator
VTADKVFIGRHDEGARLRRLLVDAAAGRGGAVAVVGDAGVGKSALLDHVVAERPPGSALLRVTGVEVESGLAHVGLATLVAQAGAAAVDSLDPAGRTALRAAVGQAEGAPVGLSLHMAALALVTTLAAERPLVLVLDDVHWIDAASRGVLAFVARRIADDPVAVLVAGRPSPDVDVALAGVDRVELAPLPVGDAVPLLAPHGVAPAVARACWAATGGNPLALVELAAALGPDERSGVAPLPDPIPVAGPIRAVFARRLAPLAPGARRALAVAAVEATGAAAVVARALTAAGAGPADLAAAEEAGFLRRVLRAGDDGTAGTAGAAGVGAGAVRWEHPLARAAVLDALGPAERRAAHRAVADALAGEDAGARVAFHLAAAAEGPDEAVAARLDDVARRSTERGALQAAATAWSAAAELSADDGPRFDRRLAGIEALWLAGEIHPVLRTGRPLVDAELDPARRAKLAVPVGQAVLWWEGPASGARYLTAEGDRARSADPTSAGYLYLYAAQAHLLGLDPRAVVDVAERAGAEGLAGGDVGVAFMAQALEGLGRLLVGDVDRARRQMAPLVDLCPGLLAAQVEGASSMAQVLSFGLVADERWDAAHELLTGVISLGERTGHVGMTALAHDQMGELEWRRGRWAEARARGTHALTLAEGQDQDQPIVHQGHLRLARIDAGRGRTATARSRADAALALGRRTGWLSLVIWAHEVLALAAAADGDTAEQLRHLDALAVLATDRRVRHPGLLWWPAAHVEALVAQGRTADAEAALARLRSATAATITDPSGGNRWARAAVARGEAALVGAAGHPDRAARRLDEAVDLLAELGAGFELALTLLARGGHHRAAGDRDAAARDLGEAHARFTHLDARPWADRAARLAGPAPRPAAALASKLTDAEMRVALVVGDGATNRQTADRLFLSIKTVDSHLQSIYRRLGIRSRSQLAALVALDRPPS